MAPDAKEVHHTTQAVMRGAENGFKFLPSNLLKPRT